MTFFCTSSCGLLQRHRDAVDIVVVVIRNNERPLGHPGHVVLVQLAFPLTERLVVSSPKWLDAAAVDCEDSMTTARDTST